MFLLAPAHPSNPGRVYVCLCMCVCDAGAAVFVTLKSILVVDLLGLDKLATAYGVLSMLELSLIHI